MKKQFNQQQKLSVIEKGEKIGIKPTAQIAGVHYTTVYAWKKQLESLGEELFLKFQTPRPGRGTKKISNENEQAILTVWKENLDMVQVRYESVCADKVLPFQLAQHVK